MGGSKQRRQVQWLNERTNAPTATRVYSIDRSVNFQQLMSCSRPSKCFVSETKVGKPTRLCHLERQQPSGVKKVQEKERALNVERRPKPRVKFHVEGWTAEPPRHVSHTVVVNVVRETLPGDRTGEAAF